MADQEARRQLEVLDGVDSLSFVTAALFLQFAERDEWVTRVDADTQAASAAASTQVRWYDADHALSSKALFDRARWLLKELQSNSRGCRARRDQRCARSVM
jgi:hypothetical protein